MSNQPVPALLELTAQIVAAHVGNNSVHPDSLGTLISSVYTALGSLGQPQLAAARPEPSVPIKKSVFPDYIICLEDGAKLKMLKRYLATRHNMTPEQYRERWGLPADYPMVAPNYTARRSELAKEIGLGRRRGEPEATTVSAKGRGRRKAA